MRTKWPLKRVGATGARQPAPWFRTRARGGGFVPCAWQGWLLIASFPAPLIALGAYTGPSPRLLARDVIAVALVACYLLVISLTGGRTVWNWFIRFRP